MGEEKLLHVKLKGEKKGGGGAGERIKVNDTGHCCYML